MSSTRKLALNEMKENLVRVRILTELYNNVNENDIKQNLEEANLKVKKSLEWIDAIIEDER